MSKNLIIFALVCTFAIGVLSQSAQQLCEGVNCQNGGTCLDGVCQCATGWFGKECTTRDLCYGVSCHSGTCDQGKCTCRKGYYGPNCQAFAGCNSPLYFVQESGLTRCDDDCDCDGERKCNLLKLCQGDPRDCGQEDYFRDETQNILGDYKCYNDCECDGKRRCENGVCSGEARDICYGVKCYNGAKCSGGKCQCTGGWRGASCQERDLCFNVDCKNGGTCDQKNGKCACPVGFIGELCQLRDECLNVDCGANGSCDSGKCVCRNGYYGPKCDLFAGCESPIYSVRETGLLTRCSNNCDCDGERTCNFLKFCFGDARDCGEEKYRRDESKNLLGAGRCVNSCECDGQRTCVEGVCSGQARSACYDVDCQNGGKCNNGACTCRGGWKGDRCQTKDLCFNVECQNGGSCNSEGKCACPAGWLGERCQVKDLCLNVNCGHNGQCVEGTCACRNGFYGPSCEAKTTCTSPIYFVRETGLLTRCSNDCDCDGRRTCNWLKFCQGDARDCGEEKYFRDESTNVLGNGQCYNSCECDGKRTCQNGVCAGEARSPCYGKSCFNGGSCNNGVCVCKAGWKGVDCRDQDPCGGVNCANGGTCSSGVCICPNGYFGDRCQNQDPCLNVNCNNGKCVSGKCQCNSGWQGALCNEVVSAGCTSPNYYVNESKNARGANKCFNDCDCDGQRTCGSSGNCQGTARTGDYKNIKADDFCNNADYKYEEGSNKGRCQNDCQCDGRRTCNWFGFCWGTARFI